MRTTIHNGRKNRKGQIYNVKHNDRNYDIEKADNIKKEYIKYNRYWNFYGDTSLTFEEVELKFYNEYFKDELDRINNNYIKNRHPEKVKTMEQWKSAVRYTPEETIRQVGNREESIDRELLIKINEDYEQKLDQWNKEHKFPFAILTRSYHFDEEVPHIHERKVWIWDEEINGRFVLKIGQEKALEKARSRIT